MTELKITISSESKIDKILKLFEDIKFPVNTKVSIFDYNEQVEYFVMPLADGGLKILGSMKHFDG